jgi:hypothetical protein
MLITIFTASNSKFIDYIQDEDNHIIADQTLLVRFIEALKEVSTSQELIFRAKYSKEDALVIFQVWKDRNARRRFESLYDHEKILATFPDEWNWTMTEEEVTDVDIDLIIKEISTYPHHIIQVDAKNGIEFNLI